MVLAAAFGALTALAFSIWPVAQAGDIPAATLFRSLVAPQPKRPGWIYVAATVIAALALMGLAVLSAGRPLFALWFVLGAAGALAAFRACGAFVMLLAAHAPRLASPAWRLAIANLHRPAAPTATIVMSLGLGLAVLTAIALIEANLDRRLAEDIPATAPSFFFIDIQRDQLEAFTDRVAAHVGVEKIEHVPMLRGRIAAINGVPAAQAIIAPDSQWTLNGDRGITWSVAPVANADMVAGDWWAPDYHGPTLISFDAETARGFGVGIGDTLTVNILGREVQGTIANLRQISWGTLAINFLMVFSPGILDGAPQTHIATVYAAPESEIGLQTEIAAQFANISAVRVRDAVETVSGLVARITTALQASALTTLLAGLLVLGGAVAADQRRRVYDAVILKVLGATRGRIAGIFAIEFGLIGVVTALVAAAIGTLAAWAVVTIILDMDWVFMARAVIATGLAGTAVTLTLGFIGTFIALGQKAAPVLRNE